MEMFEFILFLIAMGLLDSLNPFSIGLQIVLLPIVKKKHHAIWYIIGVFATYFIGGIAIFTGLNIILKNIFLKTNFSAMPYPLIELVLGMLLATYILTKLISNKNVESSKKVLTVNQIGLFLLGASSTIFDLPTAIPYLAILSKATSMNFSVINILPFIALYCIIYLLPMIIIQIVFSIFHERVIQKLMIIKIGFDKFNKVFTIIFSIIISLFLIIDSIFSLLGKPLF